MDYALKFLRLYLITFVASFLSINASNTGSDSPDLFVRKNSPTKSLTCDDATQLLDTSDTEEDTLDKLVAAINKTGAKNKPLAEPYTRPTAPSPCTYPYLLPSAKSCVFPTKLSQNDQ